MISRRKVLTGGIAAGAAGAAGASPARAADDDNGAVLSAILDELRGARAMERIPGAAEIDSIRRAQRTFLKQAGKFPDQIEVGVDVWERVLDWLVSTRQRPEIERAADGRYVIRFFTTGIVLKPELPDSYISPGA
jgi:hypothetical protein